MSLLRNVGVPVARTIRAACRYTSKNGTAASKGNSRSLMRDRWERVRCGAPIARPSCVRSPSSSRSRLPNVPPRRLRSPLRTKMSHPRRRRPRRRPRRFAPRQERSPHVEACRRRAERAPLLRTCGGSTRGSRPNTAELEPTRSAPACRPSGLATSPRARSSLRCGSRGDSRTSIVLSSMAARFILGCERHVPSSAARPSGGARTTLSAAPSRSVSSPLQALACPELVARSRAGLRGDSSRGLA